MILGMHAVGSALQKPATADVPSFCTLISDETFSYGTLTADAHVKTHSSSFGCYNEVAMGKSVPYTPISTVSIIPPMLHTH